MRAITGQRAAADKLAYLDGSHARERQEMAQRVNESIVLQAPVGEIFAYWSNFENFPNLMPNLMQNIEEVRTTGEDTSHWRVKGPLGKSVEFDAR